MRRAWRGKGRGSSTGFGLKLVHKQLVYPIGAALLLSALPWLFMTYAAPVAGIDEYMARSVEVWALKTHGAAAMLSLIALGSMLPQHVRWAWRARRNRCGGAIILGLAGLLIATGYLLYYAGEETRTTASLLHQVLGLMAPAGLAAHICLGRRRVVQRHPKLGWPENSVSGPRGADVG